MVNYDPTIKIIVICAIFAFIAALIGGKGDIGSGFTGGRYSTRHWVDSRRERRTEEQGRQGSERAGWFRRTFLSGSGGDKGIADEEAQMTNSCLQAVQQLSQLFDGTLRNVTSQNYQGALSIALQAKTVSSNIGNHEKDGALLNGMHMDAQNAKLRFKKRAGQIDRQLRRVLQAFTVNGMNLDNEISTTLIPQLQMIVNLNHEGKNVMAQVTTVEHSLKEGITACVHTAQALETLNDLIKGVAEEDIKRLKEEPQHQNQGNNGMPPQGETQYKQAA